MPNSTAQKFLDEASNKWPRMPDSSLETLNPLDQLAVRSMEETMMRGQYQMLVDLITNCSNKYAFAKQYVTFKRSTDFSGAPPDVPPEVVEVVRGICVMHSKALQRFMEDWFFIQWGNPDDPIFKPSHPGGLVLPGEAMERCANSIPRVGCPILLSFMLAAVSLWVLFEP